MDFATLVITLFSRGYLYFGAGKLNWTGTAHYAIYINYNLREAASLQQLISLNSSYANIMDACEHIKDTLNRLENDQSLRIRRIFLAPYITEHIATGDLTLETFLQLIERTSALIVTSPVNNEYDVPYRISISRGIPHFFDTVANLIRILRSPYPSQKNTSFIVRFHPLSGKDTWDAPSTNYQANPGTLVVRSGSAGETSPSIPTSSKATKPNTSIFSSEYLVGLTERTSAPKRTEPAKEKSTPKRGASSEDVRSPAGKSAIYIDPERKDIRIGSAWCGLDDVEFALFCALEQNAGRACSYKRLSDVISHCSNESSDWYLSDSERRSKLKTVNARIGALRRKMANLAGKSFIYSVTYYGYRYDGSPAYLCGHEHPKPEQANKTYRTSRRLRPNRIRQLRLHRNHLSMRACKISPFPPTRANRVPMQCTNSFRDPKNTSWRAAQVTKIWRLTATPLR